MDTCRKIKAVFFDLGETLLTFGKVDSAKVFRESARISYDYLKSLGQPVGGYAWYCWRNFTHLRLRYWLSNLLQRDFDALGLLKQVNSRIRCTDAQWEQLAWLWYEPLSKAAVVEKDLVKTLAALKRLGLKLGILTNTFIHSSALERHLRQLAILDFFSVKLYSYQFGYRKPDVRIFKVAAERMGERPEETIFVGDRIGNDIKPALRAGMRAVVKAAYTNDGRAVPAGVLKINCLSELPELVKGLNA